MAALFQSIQNQRNALELLIQCIPGFRGYYQAENRREADQRLRDFGVAQLDRTVRRLHEHKRSASLAELGPLEALLVETETLRNELRHAERGYSGFFDEIKWDRPELLEEIYAQDAEIVQGVEALALAVDQADLEPARLRDGLARLRTSVEERQRSILATREET